MVVVFLKKLKLDDGTLTEMEEFVAVLSTATLGNVASYVLANLLWGENRPSSMSSGLFPTSSSRTLFSSALWTIPSFLVQGPGGGGGGPGGGIPRMEPPGGDSISAVSWIIIPLVFLAVFGMTYMRHIRARAGSGLPLPAVGFPPHLEAWQWMALLVCFGFLSSTAYFAFGMNRSKGEEGFLDQAGDFFNVYTGSVLLASALMVAQLFRSHMGGGGGHHRHHGHGRHH